MHHKRSSAAAAVVVAVLMLLVTSACGGSSSSSGDKVDLRWAFWGSSTRADIANKAVAAYTAAHPGTTVTVEFADWGPYWNKLATQYAGRDAPDVVMMDNGYLGDYAKRGALADLEQVGTPINTSALDGKVIDSSRIGGKLYSLTTGVNSQAVVVNKKVFDDAGVKVPDGGSWTWDDYTRIAKEVTDKSPKGTYGAKTTNYLDAWTLQLGDPYFNADGAVSIKPQTVAAALSFEKSLIDRGISPSAATTTEDDTGNTSESLMYTNHIGMGVYWSSEVVGIAKATGSPVALLPLPRQTDAAVSGNSGSYLKAAQSWAVSSQSKHPEQAAQFIDFLVNDPQLAKDWAVTLGAPINLSNRKAIEPGLTPSDVLALDYVDQLGPSAQTPPPLPPAGGNSLGDLSKRAQDDTFFDRATPSAAADNFVQALTQSVKDAG